MLAEYIEREMPRRWAWGTVDCVQFGIGWARARTGRPLTAFFDYRTRAEAEAGLRARGGLEEVVCDWMAANSFPLTSIAADGDIGLVASPAHWRDSVAPVAVVIRSGPWWLTREPRGIGGIELGAVAVWSLD